MNSSEVRGIWTQTWEYNREIQMHDEYHLKKVTFASTTEKVIHSLIYRNHAWNIADKLYQEYNNNNNGGETVVVLAFSLTLLSNIH